MLSSIDYLASPFDSLFRTFQRFHQTFPNMYRDFSEGTTIFFKKTLKLSLCVAGLEIRREGTARRKLQFEGLSGCVDAHGNVSLNFVSETLYYIVVLLKMSHVVNALLFYFNVCPCFSFL